MKNPKPRAQKTKTKNSHMLHFITKHWLASALVCYCRRQQHTPILNPQNIWENEQFQYCLLSSSSGYTIKFAWRYFAFLFIDYKFLTWTTNNSNNNSHKIIDVKVAHMYAVSNYIVKLLRYTAPKRIIFNW